MREGGLRLTAQWQCLGCCVLQRLLPAPPAGAGTRRGARASARGCTPRCSSAPCRSRHNGAGRASRRSRAQRRCGVGEGAGLPAWAGLERPPHRCSAALRLWLHQHMQSGRGRRHRAACASQLQLPAAPQGPAGCAPGCSARSAADDLERAAAPVPPARRVRFAPTPACRLRRHTTARCTSSRPGPARSSAVHACSSPQRARLQSAKTAGCWAAASSTSRTSAGAPRAATRAAHRSLLSSTKTPSMAAAHCRIRRLLLNRHGTPASMPPAAAMAAQAAGPS